MRGNIVKELYTNSKFTRKPGEVRALETHRGDCLSDINLLRYNISADPFSVDLRKIEVLEKVV